MDISGSQTTNLQPVNTQQTNTQRTAQTQAVRAITDPAERTAVRDYMRGHFAQYQLQTPANATDGEVRVARAQHHYLQLIADSRSERLLQEGENMAAIRTTMENARHLDRYATNGTAMVGGLPFTGVVAAQFAKPEIVDKVTNYVFGEIENGLLKAAADGAVGGMEAHFPDEFFQRLFAEAKADSFFLKPPLEKLHPELAMGLEQKKLGHLGEAMEDAKQIQTYLLGAVITGAVSAALTISGRTEAAELFNQIAVPLRNYISGLATANLKYNAQDSRQERGEALLFGLRDTDTVLSGSPDANTIQRLAGEQDWLSVYKAAKEGSILSATRHGAERIGNSLWGAAANGLDAAGKAIISANSLGGGYVGLGATFAGRAAAQYAGTNALPSSSPHARTVVGTTINTIGTGAAFGIWAFVASLTSKLSDEGKAWLNDDNHAKPKAAIRATPGAIGNVALTGAQTGYDLGRAGMSLGAEVGRRGRDAGMEFGRNALQSGQQAWERGSVATGRFVDDMAAGASNLTRRFRGPVDNDDLEAQVRDGREASETHEMRTRSNARDGGGSAG
ncbi:hypothetical protein [Pseudomonas sp. LRF_L74]|uniref:hypothetical protein n=1 Tax=Pseudomonas sp. LRF_L74 TaxID=3369422 RepID=UPI003F619BB6